MPDAVGGRYTDPGNQGRKIAELEKAVAQLQRLMANRPKIPTPEAATSGPLGTTTASATSFAIATNGARTQGWDFYQDNGGLDAAPDPVELVAGSADPFLVGFNPVKSGWYSQTILYVVQFGGTVPDGIEWLVNQNSAGTIGTSAFLFGQQAGWSGKTRFKNSITLGPTWFPGVEDLPILGTTEPCMDFAFGWTLPSTAGVDIQQVQINVTRIA